MLANLPSGAKVLIVRLRSLGDCVLTTPAIRLLKQFREDLRVAVMVEDRFADVFRGNPDVNAVLPPHPAAAAAWNPQLTVNYHGGSRSMWLTIASLARYRAGFGHYRNQAIYNLRIPRAQEILGEERPVHTAEHLASAMFWLGAPQTEIPRASLYVPRIPAERPYAVFHALASAAHKAWPVERFLTVARGLRNLEPVFIGGPGDDLSPFREFRTEIKPSLRDSMSLIQSADLFVGNDSGPAHMAAALRVPLVVLFGESNPVTWAPWKAHAQTLVAGGPMDRISVVSVVTAIETLGVTA
ncbi:MAG TPA: glycosyltransferase family 9 protein [Bryobacteraceae bacterium]|nr:glycosyltransferase family 9 protein [Bryobacteraceae bacterium]